MQNIFLIVAFPFFFYHFFLAKNGAKFVDPQASEEAPMQNLLWQTLSKIIESIFLIGYSLTMTDLIITPAKFEDMDFFLAHAREEGWNPGLNDAIPFFQTDPKGFFLGSLGEER